MRDNAVTTKKVANFSLRTTDFEAGQIFNVAVNRPLSPSSARQRAAAHGRAAADRLILLSNVLIVGDTLRSTELRHAVPVAIGDPFRYAELDGRRIAVVWSIEGDRIAVVDPGIEIVPVETFPLDDLIRDGVDLYEMPADPVGARRSGTRAARGGRAGIVPAAPRGCAARRRR